MQKRRPLTPKGVKVRTELAKRSMTQRELAKIAGITESGLMSFMRGRRSGARFIKKIEEILGIKLELKGGEGVGKGTNNNPPANSKRLGLN